MTQFNLRSLRHYFFCTRILRKQNHLTTKNLNVHGELVDLSNNFVSNNPNCRCQSLSHKDFTPRFKRKDCSRVYNDYNGQDPGVKLLSTGSPPSRQIYGFEVNRIRHDWVRTGDVEGEKVKKSLLFYERHLC